MISGAALVVQRLARALVQRGHAVLVLCASDRQTPYDKLSAGVEEVHLRSHANPFRLNERYLLWPHSEAVARLERFLPDIIHLHEPFLLALTGLEYAARCAASSVLTAHALPSIANAYTQEVPGAGKLLEAGSRAYARWLLRQVQRVVTPTQTVAKLVASQTGLQADIISNGVDLREFDDAQIARVLNRQGRRSGRGLAFTKESITSLREEPDPDRPEARASGRAGGTLHAGRCRS